MPTEPLSLAVGDESYRGRLNEPDEPTDSGVLVLPGLNHGPFGDVFDQFASEAAAEGHRVARFDSWPDEETLQAKSEDDMARELGAAVEFLQDSGCSTIAVVAKSFGGKLALTHLATDQVDRMVLWAPAVFVGDYEERPTIEPDTLATVDCPVRLLQGDEDRGMSVENAGAIVEHLPEGELVELPGEDHSFQTDQERIVEETLPFLTV